VSKSSGLPLGVEPNQVLQQDGCKGVWLGGAMWSAPRAELEAAPRPGHPGDWWGARRGGDEVRRGPTLPTGRARDRARDQAVPATDGGGRWRGGLDSPLEAAST
jgi:hypothetical protein